MPGLAALARTMTPAALAPAAAALALALAAIMMAPAVGLGPLSRHMLEHIVLMNAAAPLLAITLLHDQRISRSASVLRPLPAAATQLAALWLWHTPAALDLTHSSPVAHLLMQATLFASALWFWLSVLQWRLHGPWHGIAALLVTGKLFCLLGAILTFAPRELYPSVTSAAAHHHVSAFIDPIADQHLAGIMMLAACPLTYVLAGLVLMARWLRDNDPAREPIS